jgi:uncharacterized protein
MKKILIAGGSGFVGEHLRRTYISQYAEVYILTTQKSLSNQAQFIYWNPEIEEIEWKDIKDFNTVINLAGANIGQKYWTKKRKIELESSRINSSLFLKKLINSQELKTNYFIQSSAVGYYGDRQFLKLDEAETKGEGFLADLTEKWEQSIEGLNCNNVILRLGVVFHPKQGAFPKLIMGLKFKFLVILGKGIQYISWIDIDDLCRLILHCEEHKLIGIYNAVSPQPVQLFYLLKKLKRKLGGISIPFILPAFLVRFLLGDFSELFLFSQKASSRKIEREGFVFETPNFISFIQKYKKRLKE